MALEMSFTDPSGVTHPKGYFRVVQTNLCQSEKIGGVFVYCYRNKAERDKDSIPVAGGERTYDVEEDDFDKYFAPKKVQGATKDHVSQAYKFVKERPEFIKSGYAKADEKYYLKEDVVGGRAKEGAKEVTEATAKESYFVSAKNV